MPVVVATAVLTSAWVWIITKIQLGRWVTILASPFLHTTLNISYTTFNIDHNNCNFPFAPLHSSSSLSTTNHHWYEDLLSFLGLMQVLSNPSIHCWRLVIAYCQWCPSKTYNEKFIVRTRQLQLVAPPKNVCSRRIKRIKMTTKWQKFILPTWRHCLMEI